MSRLKIHIILLLLLCCISTYSQNYYFSKYQVEDGLSYNSATAVLQDSFGFIWIGTEDGLNRFDGVKFTVFKNDLEDTASIGQNHIYSLHEDNEGNLWVGTNRGIYIYKRKTNEFVHFDKLTDDGVIISSDVTKIIESKRGQFWIATLGQGLFIYDKAKDTLTQNSVYSAFVWDVAEDQRHRIYVSSIQDGLISFDQNGKYIGTSNPPMYMPTNDKRIYSIQSIDNNVWYSMGTNGIVCLNTTDNKTTHFVNQESNMGVVKSIESYSDQELIIGSDYGLFIFNIATQKFTRIDHALDNRNLSDQSISNIYKDREGGFWISTFLGGVNYLSKQTKMFEYYHPTYYPGLGSGRIINRFVLDSYDNIWIGTQSGIKILSNEGKITPYQIPRRNDYDVRALLLDQNKLWIGTLGYGVIVVDRNTGQSKEYKYSRTIAHSIKSNDVLSIYKSKNGNIYIGTSWGVSKYIKETDDFETPTNLSTIVTVTDMVEDDEGYLWVATHSSGVYCYDTNNNRSWHYSFNREQENSIISNAILSVFKDNEGRMWFGSNGNGLCYYDRASDSFRTHKESDVVLKNKIIYSIEQDNLNRLWVASSAGLVCVDVDGEAPIRVYSKENGIQSNQFTLNASLKSRSGKLFFGGINGFNAFYPDELKSNLYVPSTYITSVRIHSAEGDESVVKNFTHQTKELELGHTNNSFTIEFAALSYEDPRSNVYSYKLEGFDDRWINNQYVNSTSYTNLPPGDYTFRVIGTNNDGLSDNEGVSLKIRITPPWWRSNIALLCYFLLVCFLIYFLVKYLEQRGKIQAKKAIETYEKEKEKELYESKINFFVNLVHEIRTPLSLIKLPLDYLRDSRVESKGVKSTKYLDIIDKNVNYLSNIVNQLLEFQKTENKIPRLEYKQEDLVELVSELYERFTHYAELKKVELLLDIPQETRWANVDRSAIDKIIFNLVDNAIRYAKARVEIVLGFHSDAFTISVADDGQGISDEEKEKVFELFYQVSDSVNGGTGVGLAFSLLLANSHHGVLSVKNSKWGGARFELSLPYLPAEQVEQSVTSVDADLNGDSADVDVDKAFGDNTILLVEDNQDLLSFTQEALSANYNILTATNGQEALNILDEYEVDIIISDVMMPVMDGLELCRIVKTELNYSHIPVILLTAKITTEAKVEGMTYGADVYIEKPFAMKQIEMQIENILKLRAAFRKQINSQTSLADNANSFSKKDQEFLEKLEIEIENHIDESDFYIDSIAETMFMSRSSFYRKIKGITGVSPSEFLKTLRLNKAAEMLAEGTYNISEVYVYVGFSSSSYFAKCFKAQFGILPKDYQSQVKEEGR